MAETMKDAFAARQAETQGQIGKTFDENLNTQKQGLQDAFTQNMGVREQAGNDMKQAFTTASKDWQTQEARNRRNMDSFADARGLNRQAGSQQALQLNRAAQTGLGTMAAAQDAVMKENQRQIDLLKVKYNNDVQKAIADNDYKKAAALLDDYNTQNNWLEKMAAQMANFGDFSGYGLVQGDGIVSPMQEYWNASNPDLAYRTGRIDAERYRQITGAYPPGYTPPSTGGGGGGGGGDLGELWWAIQGGGGKPEPAGPTYSNDTSAFWGDPYVDRSWIKGG